MTLRHALKRYSYRYPHPAITVDCAIFRFCKAGLEILLIRREGEPFKGKWALPGGFVGIKEELEAAARRELREETGLSNVVLEQLGAFGEIKRDPRERVVSIVYLGLVKGCHVLRAASDAAELGWFPLDELPELAFDHSKIISAATRRLGERAHLGPFGMELLPDKFKLSQLQKLYEVVLGRKLDKSNFRRRLLQLGLVEWLGEMEGTSPMRPAGLYRFNRKRYRELLEKRFSPV